MTTLRNALTCLLLAALTLCTHQAYLVLVAAEAAVSTTEERIDATLRTANRVLLSAGGTAAEVRKAAKENREQFARTHNEATALITQAKTALARLDERVNGDDGLLAATTLAIKNQDANATMMARESAFAIRSVSDEARTLVTQLEPSLVALATTTGGMAESLPPTLRNIEATSVQVQVTSENVAKTTGHIEKAVDKATKPQRLVWSGLNWAWGKVSEGFAAWWRK